MGIDAAALSSLLRDLVAIDSVNPSLVPGARGEATAAKFVQGWLGARGIAAQFQEATDDPRISRPNVVARIGGSAGQTPALLLVAHLDTVGAGDMPDPFTPREANRRLYGRGALDIKSGVAAICAAAAALAHNPAALNKPLLIAAVVDEECNSLGTQKLVTEHTAQAAVVLEPTDLQLCVAHKGYAWLEVETRGRAAHGSRPEEGRDAILHMGRVLAQIEQLDRQLAARPPHPLLGRASVHASLIRGGHELSSYPAQCRLHVERRTLPGESGETVVQELHAILRELAAADAAFDARAQLQSSRAAYEIAPQAPVAAALAGALQQVTGGCAVAGMSFWTDTALLGAAGIPGVVFGPRGRGLHAAEEYVELESVAVCAEVLHRLALMLCG
jgi:acetylornithine deacetylase